MLLFAFHKNNSSFLTIYDRNVTARANVTAVLPRCKVQSQENHLRKCPCSGPTFCFTLPLRYSHHHHLLSSLFRAFAVALYHPVRSSISIPRCQASLLRFPLHFYCRSRTIKPALVNLETAKIATPNYRLTDLSPKTPLDNYIPRLLSIVQLLAFALPTSLPGLCYFAHWLTISTLNDTTCVSLDLCLWW